MPQFSIQVLKVGEMPEVPSCGVRAMQDLGKWEAFCYTMLVARAEGLTVVVNTGFPDDVSRPRRFWQDWQPRCVLHRPDEMRVERQLKRIGVNPDEVDHLIINPLGPYSTGKIELFTKATIHIGRTEWIDFQAPPPGFPSQPRDVILPPHIERWLFENWSRVRLLEDEDEVCPGVRVFSVGAHHKGSLAVAFSTARGTVIYTDAMFTYENFENNVPIGFCRNVDEFHLAVQRLRKQADILLPAFDVKLFDRHRDGVVVP